MFFLKQTLWNVRNQIDFILRSHVKWGRSVTSPRVIDEEFQKEMLTFLSLFKGESLFSSERKEGFVVLDIGARNFSLAPAFLKYFLQWGVSPEIHGIEIDAFRRLRSFHTRHDYAKFFERQTPRSHFHAMNVLDFQRDTDIAFLLNPFVTSEPHLHWGLPLSTYKPGRVFQHVKNLLAKRKGILIMSNPTEEEFEAGTELARAQGFQLLERHDWKPSAASSLKEGRIGSAWR